MSKMIRYGLLVLLAVALVALPAYANLVPTTFGFPVIVQNGSTCAFNQDTATATDFENISIQFPVHFDDVGLGASTLSAVLGGGENGGGNNQVDEAAVEGLLGNGLDLKATANVLPFGPVNLAFPDISQTVNQTQTVTHCDFAQTNEFAEFAYPFVGVGPVALPGFGFGW
ncbi:hypothetical protein Mtc_1368 [Methanocella conradii HZ254]|uniref:Uncharacterized protein n=1 Tax=Methanocella conradii (strain DSM 24694 / JCM 17849 / CGMCC 1.5162 / HZ254) TaxID=1041930 RepID=H8IAM5_METCZ|nr:hypothetical protein [Methanocella conradii]AFD00122.1 hypothetical protein Mtc_1368 [Methanocella conradii HZ254]MDI6896058.1 hypothetical protein [Methanocella conradii]